VLNAILAAVNHPEIWHEVFYVYTTIFRILESRRGGYVKLIVI
jgi:hypothetical protein